MKKKSFPLSEAYRLLEPGPVVLLTTNRKSEDNVMTMSWHTMLDFVPPLLGCVVSNRDYSFELLKSSKECVINIPTKELAKTVVDCGNVSGKYTDKFERFGLTKTRGTIVKSALIDECYASLECKVVDSRMVTKYNFFVLEIVKAWVDPKIKNASTLHHRGKGIFMVAGPSIRLKSKMK